MSWILALELACTSVERGPRRAAFGHQAPVYGGTFVVASESDLRTLDPAIGYDEDSWTFERLLFNTLLRYDAEMKLEGDLATSWQVSEDGLVWTFHLREDAVFHNGRPVVARDFVQSWERLFDPELGSPGPDFYDVIAGADAMMEGRATHLEGLSTPDDHTLVVRLSEPDATFANAVAMYFGAVVPLEEVQRLGDDWPNRPVGTGPFRVVERSVGERTVFARHEAYHEDGLPYLDGVVHLAGYGRATQFLKLEADEIHQVNRLTSPDFLWLQQSETWSPNLQMKPAVDTYAELMNTEMPPFDNVWFRRAVSSAIDRDKLRKLRNGRVRPTGSWVPPALEGFDESAPYQTYDPALARECLAKAGYVGGYPGTIEYWTLNDEASLVSAQSVQQDLAQVGIQVSLRNVTYPVYLTATGRRKTVPMSYSAWVMDYPDPRNFLETKFHCDSRADENSVNDAFYCNPEVDALLDRAARELDRQTRTALYVEAQRIILADAPYALLYHSTNLSVTQPYVRDFAMHPVYTRDMSRAWFDLEEGRPRP